MPTDPTGAKKIFYCYAHEDKALRDELELHLGVLKRLGLITTWYDREILPGVEWAREIDTHLNTSDIVLLLVSPNFISSDYCYCIEMHQAIERHKSGETVVIPIILRPVTWEETPIGELQALPSDKKPITRWPDRDEAFYDVVKGVREVATRLQKTREQWIDEGNIYWDTGQRREALAAYQQALEFNSDSGDAWYESVLRRKKGILLKSLGHTEESIVAYDDSLRFYQDAFTFEVKGHALRELRRYRQALDAYEQAIHGNPLKEDYYEYKGDMLKRLGRLEEAEQAYKKAKRLEEGKYDD
jgi:tetratricopeptide (TPR) repeat protein